MFLTRRKPSSPTQDWQERRWEYRLVVPPDNSVRMTLIRQDEIQIRTTLIDLTVRGARFRLRGEGAHFDSDALFQAVITTDGSWVVRTPARVRRQLVTPDGVEWGLEFINHGNLYGQWENALGQFFNRRSNLRTRLDFGRPLMGNLASKGIKMSGAVYDLTTRGAGLVLSHIEAAPLKLNDPARLTVLLPGLDRKLMGPAVIRSRRRFDDRDIVGIEFDLSDPEGFAAHERLIAEYCARRELELVQWQESWVREEDEEDRDPSDDS